MNELADRKIRADAIIRFGIKCIAFADAPGYALGEKLIAESMPVLLEIGVVKNNDALEQIAAAYNNCLIEPLKETIDKFNKSVLARKDAEWGRYLQKNQKPIGSGPYDPLRLSPKVHHTIFYCPDKKTKSLARK